MVPKPLLTISQLEFIPPALPMKSGVESEYKIETHCFKQVVKIIKI